MARPTLEDLCLKPLTTVIGSSAFPGWYAYFQDQVNTILRSSGRGPREALLDAVRIVVRTWKMPD